MGLGRKTQVRYSGNLALDLIWVKLVLTFSSLSYCFSSVKGEWTLGFPGQSTGTWITPEDCGKLASACLLSTSVCYSVMCVSVWSLNTTSEEGEEKDRSSSAWRGVRWESKWQNVIPNNMPERFSCGCSCLHYIQFSPLGNIRILP